MIFIFFSRMTDDETGAVAVATDNDGGDREVANTTTTTIGPEAKTTTAAGTAGKKKNKKKKKSAKKATLPAAVGAEKPTEGTVEERWYVYFWFSHLPHCSFRASIWISYSFDFFGLSATVTQFFLDLTLNFDTQAHHTLQGPYLGAHQERPRDAELPRIRGVQGDAGPGDGHEGRSVRRQGTRLREP